MATISLRDERIKEMIRQGENKGLLLHKCLLNPKGNPKLKEPMHNINLEAMCNPKQCLTCGWNKDVYAKRLQEFEERQRQKRLEKEFSKKGARTW